MRKVLLLFALTASSLVLIGAPSATADDSLCVGTLTGAHDNVVVPPGATCILNVVTVRGNVIALEDSRLRVALSNVRGNVIGEKADIVQFINSRVRENIIVKEGGPAASPAPGFAACIAGVLVSPCEVLVQNATVEEGNIQIEKMQGTVFVSSTVLTASLIRGNIKIEDNRLIDPNDFFVVSGNRVAQNLQVFKNMGPNLKSVANNTVGESLQCFENEPPFTGTPNVAREAQGQCGATPLP